MRHLAVAVMLLGLGATTAHAAGAGIDKTFTKPQGKRTWGEIFEWVTGEKSFDKSYALVVGISIYTGGFEPLQSTRNDPIRMKDFLLDEAGFDHVHVLTDDHASVARIRELMEGVFPNLVQDDDRFLFYWSGHGTQIEDARGKPLGYLPLARSARDAYWTMVSMDDIDRWDRRIRARHALFLLDACFSGLAGSEAKSNLRNFTIEQLSQPAHHLISAGTGEQQTIASERWGGSIFTDAIIRAARGEADTQTAFPKDGVVSLAEILAFVRQRIDHERRSAKWDRPITPQWNHLRSNKGEFFFLTKQKKIERAERDGGTSGELDFGVPFEDKGPAPTDAKACDPLADRLFWQSIKGETERAYFENYLEKVKAGELCGLFAGIARLKAQGPPQMPVDKNPARPEPQESLQTPPGEVVARVEPQQAPPQPKLGTSPSGRVQRAAALLSWIDENEREFERRLNEFWDRRRTNPSATRVRAMSREVKLVRSRDFLLQVDLKNIPDNSAQNSVEIFVVKLDTQGVHFLDVLKNR